MVAMKEAAQGAVIAGLGFKAPAIGVLFLILAIFRFRKTITVAATGIVRSRAVVRMIVQTKNWRTVQRGTKVQK